MRLAWEAFHKNSQQPENECIVSPRAGYNDQCSAEVEVALRRRREGQDKGTSAFEIIECHVRPSIGFMYSTLANVNAQSRTTSRF